MPRPRKRCCCRRYEADRVYKPLGVPMMEIDTTLVSLDQFEAMRLCDLENLDQEEAGQRMGVSRGTVQRLLYSGRQAVIKALLSNNALIINLQQSEATDVGMHTHPGRPRGRRRRS